MDQITEEDFGMPKNVFNDVFILSEKAAHGDPVEER